MKILRFLPLCISISLVANVAPYAIVAAKKPIAFAIVREDALLDEQLIKRYFPEDKIDMLMIASGGCTAAQLLAHSKLASLTVVDPNKAQLALTKFKVHLLTLPAKKRLEILGYLPMQQEKRKAIMLGIFQALDIDETCFGDLDAIAACGLDNFGRYEDVFEALRNALQENQSELETLFTFVDLQEQAAYIAPGSVLGDALDKALDEVMSQENLVEVFGKKATANRIQDFSRHFAQQIRDYLTYNLASKSPWMAHLLLGRFYKDCIFPWLCVDCLRALPPIYYNQNFMNIALENSCSEAYHVIHLSNILDWLSPEEAEETLGLAYRALKPGGVVIIRQLNSNLDIVQLGKDFSWNAELSRDFLQQDRSFFYRNIFVGQKLKMSEAPRVKELADAILQEYSILGGKAFENLSTMDKELFKSMQSQFFFAVNFFSRPMAALVARLPLHKDRIDIIHNILEEHGDFSIQNYHANTFKRFLETIGVEGVIVDSLVPSPVVNMFNYTLMGAATNEDPAIAIACLGVIEYAFADISAYIAKHVVENNWVKKEDLVHYNLHADIDKQHAEEFFKIIESKMDDQGHRVKVQTGLRLGAYIFNRLYEDLYQEAQNQI